MLLLLLLFTHEVLMHMGAMLIYLPLPWLLLRLHCPTLRPSLLAPCRSGCATTGARDSLCRCLGGSLHLLLRAAAAVPAA